MCIRDRGTEGDRAVLQVRDDGIGIPQDQQEKIWQRFYQVDPARREGGGAGLGLSMVNKIAQLHGGRITLDLSLIHIWGTPVRLMVQLDDGRYGAQYDQTLVDQLYASGLSELLTDSIEAMESPRTVTQEVWQQAIAPVSYTHLDVYKRQPMRGASSSPGCASPWRPSPAGRRSCPTSPLRSHPRCLAGPPLTPCAPASSTATPG